jgi:hypothetical protein
MTLISTGLTARLIDDDDDVTATPATHDGLQNQELEELGHSMAHWGAMVHVHGGI